MVRCGFMERQEKAQCVGGNQECVNTFLHYFIFIAEKNQVSVGYLFVEAYLKPVAAARETAAFPATCLCFLIGLSSHPAAALYI